MKIRAVGVEMLHADRQTEGRTDQLNGADIVVAFRNFANAPDLLRTTKISVVFSELNFGLRSNSDSLISV